MGVLVGYATAHGSPPDDRRADRSRAERCGTEHRGLDLDLTTRAVTVPDSRAPGDDHAEQHSSARTAGGSGQGRPWGQCSLVAM